MARKRQRFEELSDFWHRWGQIAGCHGMGKSGAVVAAIAKGLIGRLSAAAKGDHRAPGEAEGGARGIENFEVALNAKRPVVVAGDFCGRHERSVTGKSQKSKVFASW
jgi:hypothetical protein